MKHLSPLIFLSAIFFLSVACKSSSVDMKLEISDSANQNVEIKLFVASEKRTGYGVGAQSCFLVKYSPNEKWQYFYSEIKGFDYEPGYEYQLLLSRTERKNIPQDASRYIYTLKRIISKTAIKSSELPPNKD